MSIFPLLALGAAGAAVAVEKGATPSQTAAVSQANALNGQPQLMNVMTAGPGATTQQIQGGLKQTATGAPSKAATIAARLAAFSSSKVASAVLTGVTAKVSASSSDLSPEIQEKLDAINSYAEQAYNRLDPSARYEGAKILNDQLNLDPPLTGNESWDTIASVAGGAAGGAVGAYIGGPLGAKIGAMIGAYLGVQLEQLINQNLDEIGDWFKSKWSDITDWVGDEAQSVSNDVSNFLGSIF